LLNIGVERASSGLSDPKYLSWSSLMSSMALTQKVGSLEGVSLRCSPGSRHLVRSWALQEVSTEDLPISALASHKSRRVLYWPLLASRYLRSAFIRMALTCCSQSQRATPRPMSSCLGGVPPPALHSSLLGACGFLIHGALSRSSYDPSSSGSSAGCLSP